MGDMVEKVARDIYGTVRFLDEGGRITTLPRHGEWQGTTTARKKAYQEVARAVLEACHHDELVEALKSADRMIAELVDWFASDPDHEVSVAADAEVTRRVIRAVLAKVEASDA